MGTLFMPQIEIIPQIQSNPLKGEPPPPPPKGVPLLLETPYIPQRKGDASSQVVQDLIATNHITIRASFFGWLLYKGTHNPRTKNKWVNGTTGLPRRPPADPPRARIWQKP